MSENENAISDEAVEAAARQMSSKDGDVIDWTLYREDAASILTAAAPHMLAAVADEREGDLFRFTIAQREWLRSNPYGNQA